MAFLRWKCFCCKRPNKFTDIYSSSAALNNYTLHKNHIIAWWRHQVETFSALLAFCAANSPVPGEFPTQRPVTGIVDVFFDLRPNKQWGWWLETPSRPLSRQCNGKSEPLIESHERRKRHGTLHFKPTQIAKFMGPTWGLPCRISY